MWSAYHKGTEYINVSGTYMHLRTQNFNLTNEKLLYNIHSTSYTSTISNLIKWCFFCVCVLCTFTKITQMNANKLTILEIENSSTSSYTLLSALIHYFLFKAYVRIKLTVSQQQQQQHSVFFVIGYKCVEFIYALTD